MQDVQHRWIPEPPQRAVTVEQQIAQEMQGAAPGYLVSIFDYAVEDMDTSTAAALAIIGPEWQAKERTMYAALRADGLIEDTDRWRERVREFVAERSVAIEECRAKQRRRFKNVPYIAVRIIGQQHVEYNAKPLTDEHKKQWPRAWKAYTDRATQPPETSIALLPGITPADVRELECLELPTVERLAAYGGDDLANLERFRTLARRLVSLTKPRARMVGGQWVTDEAA